MHLFKFTTLQKLGYLGLAQKLIAADNKVSKYEADFLVQKLKEMGFDIDFRVPDKTVKELLKPFDTRTSKVWLVVELFILGHFDEELAPEELKLIEEVAKGLGFKKGEIDQLKKIGEGIEDSIKAHRALY